MTCKNCLHYEACKGTYYTAKGCDNIALYDFDGEMYADSGCEDFADRLKWVHLPCKAGDKVYQTDGIRFKKRRQNQMRLTNGLNTVRERQNIAHLNFIILIISVRKAKQNERIFKDNI